MLEVGWFISYSASYVALPLWEEVSSSSPAKAVRREFGIGRVFRFRRKCVWYDNVFRNEYQLVCRRNKFFSRVSSLFREVAVCMWVSARRVWEHFGCSVV